MRWNLIQQQYGDIDALRASLATARLEIERLKRIETAARAYRKAQKALDNLQEERFVSVSACNRFAEARTDARKALDAALAEPQGKEEEPAARERLVVAASKAGIAYAGPDTPDALAEEVLALRAALARGIAVAAERLSETKGD